MAQVIRQAGTNVVLLFSETTVRPVITAVGEELRELDDLPDGIAKFTTTLSDDGTLGEVTQPAINIKQEVLARATAHARELVLLMNPIWLHSTSGSARDLDGSDNVGDRWNNTYFWMLAPLAAINAIVASTDSQWGDDEAQDALEAYQSLCPLDGERIDFWYRNHNRTIWNVYRDTAVTPVDPGVSPVWFRWTRGAPIPTFASDATSSTQWVGIGGTLQVTIPKSAGTAEEVLA